MNWKNIATVYLKELTDMLRDKRTVRSMIVMPLVMMPAMSIGIIKLSMILDEKVKAETPTVMLFGAADSPAVVAQLKEKVKVEIVPEAADWKQRISDKKLRVAVQLPAEFEAALKTGIAPAVTIYYYSGEARSASARDRLTDFFNQLSVETARARLVEHGLPAALAQPFETKRENVAPPEKVGGAIFGGLLPYMIIILCFTGAVYPALDLTAGEKERGTMETLLCSPVNRRDIVLGKFLMVLTGSLSAMALSLISMTVSIVWFGSTLPQKAAPTMSIAPEGLLGVLAMILPVSVLFSAVIFTVALFAKSFKEAQSYVQPMIFIVIAPAVVGILPGIELNAKYALVPILNLSLVCKEMLSGVWHWNYIALIFGSSCVYAGLALTLAVRMFNREDVIFRT